MVAWVVKTVPTAGASFFRVSRPAPHIHSWKRATERPPRGCTKLSWMAAITSPQAVANMTGSM